MIGAGYLVAAGLFLMVLLARDSNLPVRVIAVLIAAEFAYFGLRLIVTSKFTVSPAGIRFRERTLRSRVIERDEFQSAHVETRHFFFRRCFPCVTLTSGEVVKLLAFEQSENGSNDPGGSVQRVMSALAKISPT